MISTYSWSDTLKRVKVEFEAKAGSNVELHNTATRVEVTVCAPTSADGGGDGGDEGGRQCVANGRGFVLGLPQWEGVAIHS